MKKFLIKSGLFLLALAACIFLLSLVPRKQATSDYFLGMKAKHERLDSIQSPKIIIAGGSNMALGIDSGAIQEEFGLPVVNLALQAGLGTSFILEELKQSISEGDIVILTFEYYLGTGDRRLQKLLISLYPEGKSYYKTTTWEELKYHTTDIKENLKNIIINSLNPGIAEAEENGIYHKDAFNQYGDVVSHFGAKKPSRLNGRSNKVYRHWEGIEMVNQFIETAEKKGVSVFYLYPTHAQSEYEINEGAIERLAKDIEKELKAPILNTPKTFVYPDSLYFDTVYHLDEVGREMRTREMITRLKNSPEFKQAVKP